MKRDANFIKKNCTLKKDSYYCKQDTKLMLPSYYREKGLASFGDEINIVGNFAIIMGDKYAFFSALAKYRITPDTVKLETVDDMEYIVFNFKANTPIIDNINAIKDGTIIYQIFSSFLFRGKVPWYMDYDDFCKVLNSSSKYTGIPVDKAPELIELLVSIATRNVKDDRVLARFKPNDEYKFVPLANINYGASSNFNRLIGNYQQAGIPASIMGNPVDVTPTEKALRS